MHNIFKTCFLKRSYIFRCLNASSSSSSGSSSYYAKVTNQLKYGQLVYAVKLKVLKLSSSNQLISGRLLHIGVNTFTVL